MLAEYDGNDNVVRIVETKTGGVVDTTENVYDDFDRRTKSNAARRRDLIRLRRQRQPDHGF